MRPVLVALILTLAIVPAQPTVSAQTCIFTLGFAMLRQMILEQHGDIVGRCLENERFNLNNGNAEQRTTGGLLVWRKADNWTAFTNGSETWLNGRFGLAVRPNAGPTFAWEASGPTSGTLMRGYAGEYVGHFVSGVIQPDGLVTIRFSGGRVVRDGQFVTAPDGVPDTVTIQVDRLESGGGRAYGRVISSSDGQDRPGSPVDFFFGDGGVGILFSGGHVALVNSEFAGQGMGAMGPVIAQRAVDLGSVWVVILRSDLPGEQAAYDAASEAHSAGFRDLYVIYSTDYPNLRPGLWVVSTGRFSDERSAAQAAASARSRGYSTAYERWIGPHRKPPVCLRLEVSSHVPDPRPGPAAAAPIAQEPAAVLMRAALENGLRRQARREHA